MPIKFSCPHCHTTFIVKVPLLVKDQPKDWRKADKNLPAGARRDEPAPEGAWGSNTSGSNVSRQALLEADAIPAARERLSPVQLAKRIGGATALILVIGLGTWWGMNAWAQGRESRAAALAEQYL